MAHGYLPVDRDQRFWLPTSFRELLGDDHLVWGVVEAVERFDLSGFEPAKRVDGKGRAGYHPAMMVALLLYAYCRGVYSSRAIERACREDLGFRAICAGHEPDHSTISRFFTTHREELAGLHTRVLALCAEVGMVDVGVAALDSTKLGADASDRANRRYETIAGEVESMHAAAAAADAADGGDEARGQLPSGLRDPGERQERFDAAGARLTGDDGAADAGEAAASGDAAGGQPADAHDEAGSEAAAAAGEAGGGESAAQRRGRADRLGRWQAAKQRLEQEAHAEHGAWQQRQDKREQAAAEGRKPSGRPRKHSDEEPTVGGRRANTTDPDSRRLKSARGYVQGYSAQTVVSRDEIILAAELTNEQNDQPWLHPMLAATRRELAAAGGVDTVEVLLADNGYYSDANLTDAAADDPELLIATAGGDKLDAVLDAAADGETIHASSTRQALADKLATPRGRELYRQRQHLAEAPFGDTKHNKGFTRFSRRGQAACDAEFKLVCAARNLRRWARTRPTGHAHGPHSARRVRTRRRRGRCALTHAPCRAHRRARRLPSPHPA